MPHLNFRASSGSRSRKPLIWRGKTGGVRSGAVASLRAEVYKKTRHALGGEMIRRKQKRPNFQYFFEMYVLSMPSGELGILSAP